MALEFMHNEMQRQLKEKSASNGTIEKYEFVWSSAMRNSNLPIPCPLCFIQGGVARLKPLRDEKKISSARCESCKSKFEWSSPD